LEKLFEVIRTCSPPRGNKAVDAALQRATRELAVFFVRAQNNAGVAKNANYVGK